MTFDIPRYTLNDDQTVPVIGFGTYPLRGDDGVEAMVHALEVGYRLLDSAVNYGNEEEVGEAVRRSGLAREDVQVTTKIPGRHHEYDQAIGSVEESLRRMRFDYLDLVLIHWPNPSVGRYVDAWRALVELRKRGLVRSIGVSNFTEQHLRDVIDDTGVTPAVNQIELHPYFPQQQMLQVNADLGIQTESW
ncbi:MAG: aldo/keto reductase, partial [Nocardioides sp.]